MQRRSLPWRAVEKDYRFDTTDGPRTLSELFGDNNQLIIYHFMMGPGWVEGCPSCSFWADNLNGIGVHLAHRDASLVAISRAPLDEIRRYQERMGWSFPWHSSFGSDFNFDFAVSFTDAQIEAGETAYNFGTQGVSEEMPGLSVFRKLDDGQLVLTYQTFSRGLDMINGAYHLLDMTSKGRDEDDLEWSMAWLHRHDAYPD